MAKPFSWRCPYCNQIATITSENTRENKFFFNDSNKDGDLLLLSITIVCPNIECKEYMIKSALYNYKYNALTNEKEIVGERLHLWELKPQSYAKQFPQYIPQAIIQDYNEACLISSLSPKASATLSRRCLQGMISDFWNIKKNKLVDAINAIQDQVDPITWQAIDAVRSIGNIGAHMEKDINLIIDVEPEEATLLINLIETLLDEWYVHRHERQQKMEQVIDAAASKHTAKIEAKQTT